MITMYLAKVVEHYSDEDTIDVVFLRNSHSATKVKVLHDKANALYGRSGNLPDVGEIGLVAAIFDYGQEYYWLGSVHDACDNICTKDATDIGRDLYHHESDVYHQICKDGTVEFSHPSGTYIKIGPTTTLKPRKRFRRLEGKYNERFVEEYPNRQAEPAQLTINHTWVNGTMSNKVYSLDARKQVSSGDLRNTKVVMDTTGTVTLDHETTAKTHMKITIAPSGDVTVYSDHITLRGISADTAVDVIGTIHATKWIKSDTDVIGNMVYDQNGGKSMLGMRSAYNPHVHGSSEPPSPSMG